MRPVLIAGLQGLFEQHCAEARTVDEEVTFHPPVMIQFQGLDEAVRPAQLHIDDLAFQPGDPKPLGIGPQMAGVQRGIEMEGRSEGRERRIRILGLATKPAAVGRLGAQGVVVQRPGPVEGGQFQPVLMEVAGIGRDAVHTERMEVGLAGPCPAMELDTQLVGALGLADEAGLVQAQGSVEDANGRDGGLADPHRADLGGLDQGDGAATGQRPRQQGRRHPARRAAAQDDDRTGQVIGFGIDHETLLSSRSSETSPGPPSQEGRPR